MSYDIRFNVKVAGAENVYAEIGRPEYDSPTYNVGTIFRKSMDWDFKQSEYYPMNEVLPKIEKGIHELQFNASKYKKYEPDNGWGSVSSALTALKSIMSWFTDPFNKGWDEDIPLECIYMRW